MVACMCLWVFVHFPRAKSVAHILQQNARKEGCERRRPSIACLRAFAMASRFLSRQDSGESKASDDAADVGAGPVGAEAARIVFETVMRPPAAKKYPNNIREWLVRSSPGQKRTGAQLERQPKATQPGKQDRAAAAAASSSSSHHHGKEQSEEDTSRKQNMQLAAAKKLSKRTGTVVDGPGSKVDAEKKEKEEGDEEEPAEGGEEETQHEEDEEEEAEEAAEEETQEDEEEEADEDNEEEDRPEAKSTDDFAKFREATTAGKLCLPTKAATPTEKKKKKKTDQPATTSPMKAKTKKAMTKATCSKSMKMCKSSKTKASKCKSKAMKQSKQTPTMQKQQSNKDKNKKKSAKLAKVWGKKKKATATARAYATRGTQGTFAGRRPPANKAMLAHFNHMKRAYACAQRLVKEEKKSIRISQGDFVDEFTAIWDELANDTNVKPENRVQMSAVAYIKMCIDKKDVKKVTPSRSKV